MGCGGVAGVREKIVLIGAGSAMFTRGLVADLARSGAELDIALVDIDPNALGVVEALSRRMIEAQGSGIRLSASTERRDVLSGATAVITTIGVGGRRAWERDVLIPRKFGVYQPVGDSVMPGGTSRALRMIPQMVDIARDVQAMAPGALFFNYGNPVPAICRAVRKATGANIVGLCHGVWHTAGYLAACLGVAPDRLTCTGIGMNHLTWLMDVRVDGADATGRLHGLAARKLSADGDGDNPFAWQLFELYGAFPAVLDRHISEFFTQFYAAGKYCGGTLGVDRISFEDVIADGDRIFEEMRQAAFSPGPLSQEYFDSISGEHEQVVEIIDSIRIDAGRVYSANLPNTGQVPNLPIGAIIECPAVAGSAGLTPLPQKPLPTGVASTLVDKIAWVELVVEAALEGSRAKFVQALVVDGSVGSLEDAYRLADELLAAQAEYLPRFAGGGR